MRPFLPASSCWAAAQGPPSDPTTFWLTGGRNRTVLPAGLIGLNGYCNIVSTNGLIPGRNPTNTIFTNFLAHSGAYTFQMFDTTSDGFYMYQDYPCRAGSTWSAQCWAICYQSNYFDSAYAYMSVAFFDTNGFLLGASFDSGSGGYPAPFKQYGYGVYGSAVLDPFGYLGTANWIITPPQATDASGWLYLPATNWYYGYLLVSPTNVPGTNVESSYDYVWGTTNIIAPPGAAVVRYQLEFDNTSSDGGDVYWDDCQLVKLTWSDPDFTNPLPTSVSCYVGDPAQFAVKAVTKLPAITEKLSYQWQKNGTNLPMLPGGAFIGYTTNATLILTNLQVSDSGIYTCLLVDTNSWIRSVPVTLKVSALTPRQKVNVCGANAGFENAPAWPVWTHFNGANMVNTNSWLDAGQTTPVNIFDGNYVALIGSNGDRDNGFWAHFPCASGTTWKADGWAYISSLNDFTNANTCRLQIWFLDANGLDLTTKGTPTFESFKIYGLDYNLPQLTYCSMDASSPNNGVCGLTHDQLPRDQWCDLFVTNVTTQDGVTLTNDIIKGTWQNGVFVVPTAPTNANPVGMMNMQVYELSPVAGDANRAGKGVIPDDGLGNATDIVYWDDMESGSN